MKKSVVFVLVFLTLISFVNATCSISTSCPNPLIYASATFNAHVSSTEEIGYTSLCCTDYTLSSTVIGATEPCTGAVPFYMSGETNAHIEKAGLTPQNYGHKLCLTGVEGLTCEYSTNPYGCEDGFFCLLDFIEVNGFEETGTNAHVAGCNVNPYYLNKICCTAEEEGCVEYQEECSDILECCSELYCSGDPQESRGCCEEDEEWIENPLIPDQWYCGETGSCAPPWSSENQGSYEPESNKACCGEPGSSYWRTVYLI